MSRKVALSVSRPSNAGNAEVGYEAFASQVGMAAVSSLRNVVSSRLNPEMHEHLLQRLWTGHFGDGVEYARPDERWKEMGFQGIDPCTDLRAGGLMALLHLVHLVETCPALWKKLTDANCGTAAFSKAVCLVNVTGSLIYYLQLYVGEQDSSAKQAQLVDPCAGDGGNAAAAGVKRAGCGGRCCCGGSRQAALRGFEVLLISQVEDKQDEEMAANMYSAQSVDAITGGDDQLGRMEAGSPMFFFAELFVIAAHELHLKMVELQKKYGELGIFHFTHEGLSPVQVLLSRLLCQLDARPDLTCIVEERAGALRNVQR